MLKHRYPPSHLHHLHYRGYSTSSEQSSRSGGRPTAFADHRNKTQAFECDHAVLTWVAPIVTPRLEPLPARTRPPYAAHLPALPTAEAPVLALATPLAPCAQRRSSLPCCTARSCPCAANLRDLASNTDCLGFPFVRCGNLGIEECRAHPNTSALRRACRCDQDRMAQVCRSLRRAAHGPWPYRIRNAMAWSASQWPSLHRS